MDLGFVQTALADFSTFAKNIFELFTNAPKFFGAFGADWKDLAGQTKGLFTQK